MIEAERDFTRRASDQRSTARLGSKETELNIA